MANIIYLILILAVAFIAFAFGFRKGFTGQISSVLGFGFGAVAARIFTPECASSFKWTYNLCQAPEFNEFTANLICAVVIYCVVYCLFSFLGIILKKVFAVIELGMFNRIMGAFFSLTKDLLWLSIGFNLLLCFSSGSGLLQYERGNDGNLVASVMAVTPAILGCYGAEDFAHFNQLKEAKTISRNFNTPNNVIISQG